MSMERFDNQHQTLACPKCGKQPPADGHDVRLYHAGEPSEPTGRYLRAEEVLVVSCVRCGGRIGGFTPLDAEPVTPAQDAG
jgi:hypothetical protein